MAYAQTPGPVGRDPDASDGGANRMDVAPIVGLGDGIPDGPEPLDSSRKITRVTRDWGDPPTPKTSFTPQIGGKSLKEALAELQRLPEWGTGGGNLNGTGDGGEIQLTTTDGHNYLAELKGDFFVTLPTWSGYAQATAAQKLSWDTMIGNLRKHEEEHVAIAYRGAQKLIQTLTNLKVELAAQKMADSRDAVQAQQDEFDSAAKTDHGRRDFGGFRTVELDVSADPTPPPAPSRP